MQLALDVMPISLVFSADRGVDFTGNKLVTVYNENGMVDIYRSDMDHYIVTHNDEFYVFSTAEIQEANARSWFKKFLFGGSYFELMYVLSSFIKDSLLCDATARAIQEDAL